MTIRLRLGVALLAIFVLFGANLSIFFWGNAQRNQSVEELNGAVGRRTLLSTLDGEIEDRDRELVVLQNLALAGRGAALSQDQVSAGQYRLNEISKKADQLRRLADAIGSSDFNEFDAGWRELEASWGHFYTELGIGATSRDIAPQAPEVPVAEDQPSIADTSPIPDAMASRVTFPNVSVSLGNRNTSDEAYAAERSSPRRYPANMVPGSRFSNVLLAGPSPIIMLR